LVDDPTVSLGPESDPSGESLEGSWGPLKLIQKVGKGSFGEVYRAFDTTLQREVALKLLLPRGLDAESETDRRRWA
jgi:serine/threonine protein kinase